ncbi:MAG: hypothetical protein E5V49_00910 [Mesorhizobium sp.]|nr:hypothetical protein EN848_22695 [bacterium M00.F.Ca.ET.205.01.1.1]TGU49391.1 hypothetical protein EN795_23975 [bacterium M00.F.Ca.ET.152.01.1.1]TGV33489.1 hypothetical protein EN829_021930 [Mesorhizobium sp. M00.F.Ca.ET.186.01.1.1]TGZ40394.1 hypothetical protein EN805_23370 [bacterium M00.F.Ca.ET.162.01.1.1]TIW63132.1 MAG: hypothetical protein E5V48_01300 [Mesorhizobium sp.]
MVAFAKGEGDPISSERARRARSAPDLDLRPAAWLEEQAGHMTLIGLGLHRRLLALAVDQARGRIVESCSRRLI